MAVTYRISRLWDGSLDTTSEADDASDVIIKLAGKIDVQVVEMASNENILRTLILTMNIAICF